MFFIVLPVLVMVFVLFLVDLAFKRMNRGHFIDMVPRPKGYPVIGNMLDIMVEAAPLFYLARALANQYKDIYRAWVLNMRFVNLYSPEDVEIVLSSPKHMEKGIVYEFLRPWLNEGLLLSKGEKWHHRRRILTPAFHFQILKSYFSSIQENSEKFVQALRPKIGSETIDIVPPVTKCTLNTICESAMGTTLYNDTSSVANAYEKGIHQMGLQLVYRLVRFWLYPECIFSWTRCYRQQQAILKDLHDFPNLIIDKRKESIRNGVQFKVGIEGKIGNGKNRMAMLDLLLAAENEQQIDDAGIREEVETFIFEGHDTTAMALCFILMLLANNRGAQDQLYAEIMTIIEAEGSTPTMDDLSKMKYMDCCIKEGLRLYPSVPFIMRTLHEDIQLTNYFIPSGTHCCVHIYDLHRRADLYPDPEVFQPERFSPGVPQRHPYAYIPFSAGPRNCIGQKFAFLQLKSVITTLLRSFILEPVTTPENIVLVADMVLRPKDPILIKITPRI